MAMDDIDRTYALRLPRTERMFQRYDAVTRRYYKCDPAKQRLQHRRPNVMRWKIISCCRHVFNRWSFIIPTSRAHKDGYATTDFIWQRHHRRCIHSHTHKKMLVSSFYSRIVYCMRSKCLWNRLLQQREINAFCLFVAPPIGAIKLHVDSRSIVSLHYWWCDLVEIVIIVCTDWWVAECHSKKNARIPFRWCGN